MRLLRLFLVLLLAGPADAARVLVPRLKTGGPVVTRTAIPTLTVGTGLSQPPIGALSKPSFAITATGVSPQVQAQAQVQALVESLPAPEAPAEQGGVALGNFWSGGKLAAVTETAPQVPGEIPGYSTLSPAEISRAVKKLGAVPKPRVALTKALTAAYWVGLSALIIGMHAPYDKPATLIIGAVLGAFMGLIVQSMLGAASQIQQPAGPTGTVAAVPPRLLEQIRRVSASMGLPPPREIRFTDKDSFEAAVQGDTPGSYVLHLTTRLFKEMPPEVMEAILRHEFSHVKHYDGITRTFQIWLAPALMGVALMGGAVGVEEWFTLPAFLAPLLSFPFFMKLDEYHADQNAAATQGSAGPMASFFIKDANDSKAVAAALSGKAFPQLSGWRLAAKLAWVTISRYFKFHPAHEQRVARLARLAAPPQAPPVESIVKGEGPTEWIVNGKSVYEMGWGAFKKVVPHPDDSDYVVKIFKGYGNSLSEMRSDLARSLGAASVGLTPRVATAGSVEMDGKPLGYIVQERVQDAVESLPSREFVAELSAAGWALEDAEPHILRKNLLRGSTLTGGTRLWLVDPDVVPEVR
jgi:Zn-dependent protease with chaperone function